MLTDTVVTFLQAKKLQERASNGTKKGQKTQTLPEHPQGQVGIDRAR